MHACSRWITGLVISTLAMASVHAADEPAAPSEWNPNRLVPAIQHDIANSVANATISSGENFTRADKSTHLTALFVYNRAGPNYSDKQSVFQNYLASRLAGGGFVFVSRTVAVSALGSISSNRATTVDKMLEDHASALRLAQMMNADYILVAALDSFGTKEDTFTGYGVVTTVKKATLRASYTLCDATNGGAVAGDVVSVDVNLPDTANLKEVDKDALNQLVDRAAAEIAADFKERVLLDKLPAANGASRAVPFSISCSVADIMLPEVSRTANGDYVVGPLTYTLSPLDVTVVLNGAAVGSAPGNFTGSTGLSTLSLKRQGFKTWDQAVNLTPGFKLNVALQMDEDGLARWRDNISFLQSLKTNAKLTDAEIEKIKAIAQMLRQSGLRFDERSDVKVNANQLPAVQQVNQSLFAVPPVPAVVPGSQP